LIDCPVLHGGAGGFRPPAVFIRSLPVFFSADDIVLIYPMRLFWKGGDIIMATKKAPAKKAAKTTKKK